MTPIILLLNYCLAGLVRKHSSGTGAASQNQNQNHLVNTKFIFKLFLVTCLRFSWPWSNFTWKLPITIDLILPSTSCSIGQTCPVHRTKTFFTYFKSREQNEKALLPQFSLKITGLDNTYETYVVKNDHLMLLNSKIKAVMTHAFPCTSRDEENYLGLFTAAMHRWIVLMQLNDSLFKLGVFLAETMV